MRTRIADLTTIASAIVLDMRFEPAPMTLKEAR